MCDCLKALAPIFPQFPSEPLMLQVSGHKVVAVQAPDRLGTNTAQEVIATEKQYILQTYSRPDVVFVRGQGTKMYDTEGKEYLDFAAGIAVNALGAYLFSFISELTNFPSELAFTAQFHKSRPLFIDGLVVDVT